jgi:microcystin-dependent protein
MATPYLGQIKMCAFAFPPQGYALCNGQLLPINQNQALFALLGTTYGGNGTTTFALPNLQGRVALHADGSAFPLGQSAGGESHMLLLNELPSHTHALNVSSDAGGVNDPAAHTPALAPLGLGNVYGPNQSLASMAMDAVSSTGGSQSHENRQPFLTVNFVIALLGIFPSRN